MTTTEFEIFARNSRSAMLNTARAILHNADEAEDVVQEVLLKLFAIRDRIDADSNPTALAQVAVRHTALNVLRDTKRHPSVEFKVDMVGNVTDAEDSEVYNTLLADGAEDEAYRGYGGRGDCCCGADEHRCSISES